MDHTQFYADVAAHVAAQSAAHQLAELGHAGYGERFAAEVLEEAGEGRSVTLAVADVKVRWIHRSAGLDPHTWADSYSRARRCGMSAERAEAFADVAAVRS
jgi:hypothetical protein